MRRGTIHAVALTTLLGACTPTGAERATAADGAGAERAVREHMDSYAAALGTLDSARILDHYVAGPGFRLVSDGASYSHEDMQRLIGGLRGVLRGTVVRWDTVVVTALGNDAALAYAPFRRTDTDTAGRVSHLRGVATWVLVRRDGRWRALYGHGDHYPDTAAVR